MSRVKVINGSKRILVIAPHGGGPTDSNTAMMTEIIANEIGCYAVINEKWIRNKKFDHHNNEANCNSLKHCNKSPLREEFLDQIDLIKKRLGVVYIFILHGMTDLKGADTVVGWGRGNPDKLTSDKLIKDRFLVCLDNEGFTPCEGAVGGKYSGWDDDNLNQLYQGDKNVSSLQLEVAFSLRSAASLARKTACRIAEAIDRCCNFNRKVVIPKDFKWLEV